VKNKKWSFLQPGDVVDIIAPGYPSPLDQVAGGISYLQNWGLKARAPKDMIQKHFLHANVDEKRFSFLKAAIESPDSKVIWCSRGGYGSNRLLPWLAKMKVPKTQKVLIGLSDITSLHQFFTQRWGWSTLHASVLDRLGRHALPAELEKELHGILFGDVTQVTFKNLKALNKQALQVKQLKSKVVGGNLTVLQSSLGTPFEINTDRSLLFVEDIGERGYRIDRMFEQFRQAGLFKKCDGLLIGDFTGGEEPGTQKNNFNKVFARWAQDLDIPMWSGIPSGHAHIQRALPLNTPCVLGREATKFKLTVETGGVLEKAQK
jgi:muramoyltetrapeptide carboxypeptidase